MLNSCGNGLARLFSDKWTKEISIREGGLLTSLWPRAAGFDWNA